MMVTSAKQGLDMSLCDYDGRTALHLAAAEGQLPCVEVKTIIILVMILIIMMIIYMIIIIIDMIIIMIFITDTFFTGRRCGNVALASYQ